MPRIRADRFLNRYKKPAFFGAIVPEIDCGHIVFRGFGSYPCYDYPYFIDIENHTS